MDSQTWTFEKVITHKINTVEILNYMLGHVLYILVQKYRPLSKTI